MRPSLHVSVAPMGLWTPKGRDAQAVAWTRAAIADYDQARRLVPDHAVAYLNRGKANEKLGRRREAKADYDQTVCREPRYRSNF